MCFLDTKITPVCSGPVYTANFTSWKPKSAHLTRGADLQNAHVLMIPSPIRLFCWYCSMCLYIHGCLCTSNHTFGQPTTVRPKKVPRCKSEHRAASRTAALPSPHPRRYRSPLRCFHHILELHQGIICRRRLGRGGHGKEHVWNAGACDLGKGIVDIHDLAAWDGRNHLAECCIYGLVTCCIGHQFAVHAVEGVVVGHRRLLQQLAVHACTHDNHFVDGLHGCVWRDTGEGFQVEVRVPRGTLDEWVGGIRELLSGYVNGSKLGSERRWCVCNIGRDGVCLHDVLEGQESLACLLCIGFFHCCHQVFRHLGGHKRCNRIVDAHCLTLRHGSNQAADCRVDGLEVCLGQRRASLGHRANGLVMGHGAFLQEFGVHCGAHLDHFVNGLRPVTSRCGPRFGKVGVGVPIHLFHEGIGVL